MKNTNRVIVFLGIALGFDIATMIFGRNDAMAVAFGGITFAFVLAALISATIAAKKTK